MRILKVILSTPAIVILALLAGCNKGPEWVNVGSLIATLEQEPQKIRDIPYRLYDITIKGNVEIERNIDVVDLKLATQSGQAIGKQVMVSVVFCWSPDVRGGVPTVLCSAESTGDILLAGDSNIRSQLIHLKEGKQIASLVGRIIGSYAETPIILVL